jgi:3',5'-cyclic AMP phosphodiesterase CpdA
MKSSDRTSLHTWSRRQWLQTSAGAAFAAGLWPGRLRAADNGKGGSFTFAVVNDTHFFTPKCPDWFERVTASIRNLQPRPEFVLLVGDLAQDGKREELGPMREILRGFELPYHAVIGNHDYTPDGQRGIYERLFPNMLNYQFGHRDWQIVGLDSSEGTKYENTKIQPATLGWLDDNLPKLPRDKPTILFTHFPLGPGVSMRPVNADDLLKRFRDHNLVAVFNGHFHGSTEKQQGKTTITTNKCCAISRGNHDGTKEKGYFVCTAHAGQIERKFVEVVPA